MKKCEYCEISIDMEEAKGKCPVSGWVNIEKRKLCCAKAIKRMIKVELAEKKEKTNNDE